MAFVRRVRTTSGATAVQVVQKRHGRLAIIEHIGSAHSGVELAVLLERAAQVLLGGQEELDLGIEPPAPTPVLVSEPHEPSLFDALGTSRESSRGVGRPRTIGAVSDVLWSTLRSAYTRLGF